MLVGSSSTRFAVRVLIALAATAAHADPLETARAALAKSDYSAARSALDEALRAGTSGPSQLAEIYRSRGIAEAALGNATESTAAFERWLAFVPGGELPPGTSPKITRPLDAARTRGKTAAPAIKQTTASKPPSITVEIARDPLQLIATVRVIARVDGGADQPLDRPSAPSIEIALPAATRRIDLRIAALDRYGNRVVEVGSQEVPLVILVETVQPPTPPEPIATKPPIKPLPEPTKPLPQPSVPPAPPHTPLVMRWWLWGGVTAVAGGITTYFAIDTSRQADKLNRIFAEGPLHTYPEARAVEDRGRRSALITNIGIATTSAFALVTATMAILAPRRATQERSASVRVVPWTDGASTGIVLDGRWQ